MNKKFWTSKTLWFGALFVVNGFAQVFGYGDFLPSGELSELTSLGIGLMIWTLRLVTDKKIR